MMLQIEQRFTDFIEVEELTSTIIWSLADWLRPANTRVLAGRKSNDFGI